MARMIHGKHIGGIILQIFDKLPQLEAYRVLPCVTHTTRKSIWILENYAYIIGGQAIEIICINIYAYRTEIFSIRLNMKIFHIKLCKYYR